MILFFNRLPVSLAQKLELFKERALALYGSEYYNVGKDKFIGDNLTVESLLPDWVIADYEADPTNVAIVPILKNYLRWLFSQKYGYGALITWETLRSPMLMDEKLVESIGELYFPGVDFSSAGLNVPLINIRKFSIQVDYNYFSKKGTPDSIKYVLVTLLGYDYDNTEVISYGNFALTIKCNITEAHKEFIEEHVVPAGTTIIYESV